MKNKKGIEKMSKNEFFCKEVDKIKSCIDDGDLCVMLLMFTGLAVLVNIMCHCMGI